MLHLVVALRHTALPKPASLRARLSQPPIVWSFGPHYSFKPSDIYVKPATDPAVADIFTPVAELVSGDAAAAAGADSRGQLLSCRRVPRPDPEGAAKFGRWCTHLLAAIGDCTRPPDCAEVPVAFVVEKALERVEVQAQHFQQSYIWAVRRPV